MLVVILERMYQELGWSALKHSLLRSWRISLLSLWPGTVCTNADVTSSSWLQFLSSPWVSHPEEEEINKKESMSNGREYLSKQQMRMSSLLQAVSCPWFWWPLCPRSNHDRPILPWQNHLKSVNDTCSGAQTGHEGKSRPSHTGLVS